MKVDITLTVGGTDVTIDYAEGRELFMDLRALYEPHTVQGAFNQASDDKADKILPRGSHQ